MIHNEHFPVDLIVPKVEHADTVWAEKARLMRYTSISQSGNKNATRLRYKGISH